MCRETCSVTLWWFIAKWLKHSAVEDQRAMFEFQLSLPRKFISSLSGRHTTRAEVALCPAPVTGMRATTEAKKMQIPHRISGNVLQVSLSMHDCITFMCLKKTLPVYFSQAVLLVMNTQTARQLYPSWILSQSGLETSKSDNSFLFTYRIHRRYEFFISVAAMHYHT